jgi:hypothetical protein
MAARNPQTMAKRERELAVKERRDRKRARKAERAAAKTDGVDEPVVDGEQTTHADEDDAGSAG